MHVYLSVGRDLAQALNTRESAIQATNGHLRMAFWTVQALQRGTRIRDMLLVHEESAAPFPEVEQFQHREYLSQGNVLWLDVERHYWWKPVWYRRFINASFPIITMVHGLGYPYQTVPLLASLSVPTEPGDTIIAPTSIAARVLRDQCEAINLTFPNTVPSPNIKVIPYGIPPVEPILQRRARKLLGWNDRLPVVLFFGRLSIRDKADFRALFEASARLFAQGRNFHLVLAGASRSSDADELAQLADAFGLTGRIEIMENVSDLEKHCMFSACDIFVTPSNTLSESFGLTLIDVGSQSK